MAEKRKIVKSPGKAIAFALAGIVGLLAAAVLAQLFFAHQISLWEAAGGNVPAHLKPFGYFAGVGLAFVVGVVAPPVGRLGRSFQGKLAGWLASFAAGVTAGVVAVGASLFAMQCVEWREGTAALISLGQHFIMVAVMIFGGGGALKAIRG